MNAEQLLAHFETISEAPDAVARLRRFILDLAVRGKLVEQDPEDEPAEELLKAISLDSSRSKGRRTAASSSSVIATEGSFEVPDSWAWILLGGIGDWGSGSTPPRGRHEYYGGDISWFKSGELNDNKCLSDSEEKITRLALEQCSFRQNKPGDVLIAMYGATIGRLAILAEEAVTNQAVCACTPYWGVDTEYLFLFLLAKRDDFRLASEGGAQPNISKVKIVNTAIPLPPLAEQHRIVAKVDELMALCDQLEASRQQREQHRERLVAATLQRLNQPAEDPGTARNEAHFALQVLPSLTTTPAQIKQLRQTILNLAVGGKLVEQDPDETTPVPNVAELTKQKDLACAVEGLRARKPITALRRSELWFDFPNHWLLCSFDDALVIVSGVTKGQRIPPGEKAVEAPYLRVANVQRGRLDLSEVKSITVRQSDVDRYRLAELDILMTEGGDWDKLGRAAIWRGEIDGCIHQNHIFRLRIPSDSILPEWIVLFSNSDCGRRFFEDSSKQTTNLASINLTQLRSCPLPLPPLAEQHRIVAKVEELMALCDQLEQQLNQADQQRRRLLEAVLAEALREPEKDLASMGSA